MNEEIRVYNHDEDKCFLLNMVVQGITNDFVKIAESFGEYIAKEGGAVTSNQIRKIYFHIKKLELSNDVKKIIPRFRLFLLLLKYTVKKNERQTKLKYLKDVLEKAAEGVIFDGLSEKEQKERFERFCAGFEAILACHSFYSEK